MRSGYGVINNPPVFPLEEGDGVAPEGIFPRRHRCSITLSTCLTTFSASTHSCIRSAFSAAGVLGFHVLDILRIFCVIQTLTARWVWQFFKELDVGGHAPSLEVQKTWLVGLPLFASAFTIAVFLKGINHRYGVMSQDYVFAIFSSSLVFIIGDLFFSSGQMAEMPEWAFIVISAIFVPLLAGFFTHITLPDSSDRLILSQHDFQALLCQYPNVSFTERLLNMLGSVSYATALPTLFWTINREIQGRSVQAPTWQLGLIGMYFVAAAILAAKCVTDHPKPYYGFVALSRCVTSGSFAYAAWSGLTYYLVRYSNPYQTFDIDDPSRVGLSVGGALFAAAIGVFAALNTVFRFAENHAANEGLERKINTVGRFIRNSCLQCGGYLCCCRQKRSVPCENEHDLLLINGGKRPSIGSATSVF